MRVDHILKLHQKNINIHYSICNNKITVSCRNAAISISIQITSHSLSKPEMDDTNTISSFAEIIDSIIDSSLNAYLENMLCVMTFNNCFFLHYLNKRIENYDVFVPSTRSKTDQASAGNPSVSPTRAVPPRCCLLPACLRTGTIKLQTYCSYNHSTLITCIVVTTTVH